MLLIVGHSTPHLRFVRVIDSAVIVVVVLVVVVVRWCCSPVMHVVIDSLPTVCYFAGLRCRALRCSRSFHLLLHSDADSPRTHGVVVTRRFDLFYLRLRFCCPTFATAVAISPLLLLFYLISTGFTLVPIVVLGSLDTLSPLLPFTYVWVHRVQDFLDAHVRRHYSTVAIIFSTPRPYTHYTCRSRSSYLPHGCYVRLPHPAPHTPLLDYARMRFPLPLRTTYLLPLFLVELDTTQDRCSLLPFAVPLPHTWTLTA